MGSLNWRSQKFFKHSRVLSLKAKQNIFSKKTQVNQMTFNIARDRSKTLKKGKEKRKMRKSQPTAFLLLLFLYRKIYILLENIFGKTQFILLHLHYRFFTQQVIGNAVTPTPTQIFIGFVDAILRSKILDNRLGILTQILTAIDYFFYLYISDKYLQFRKKRILI